jgi:hypothetical protein
MIERYIPWILVAILLVITGYSLVRSFTQSCPKQGASCPICAPVKNKLGFAVNPVDPHVMSILNKTQAILGVLQTLTCTMARRTWQEAKPHLRSSAGATSAEMTCASIKTALSDSINMGFDLFKKDTQTETTVAGETLAEGSSPPPPPDEPIQNSAGSFSSPFSETDIATAATQVKPLLQELGTLVIDHVCVNDRVDPEKVIGILDNILQSFCTTGN